MRVITVAEWGGLRVDNSRLPRRPAAGITIHHTAGPNRKPGPEEDQEFFAACGIARAIQRDHMGTRGGRKTPWRDSGHHFLVTRGGLVLEGRNGTYHAAQQGEVILAAHCGDPAGNGTRWGIEVEGIYTAALPTPAQWSALVELCARLSLWGNTQSSAIDGHREYKPTQCPGDAFFKELARLRHDVRARKLALMEA